MRIVGQRTMYGVMLTNAMLTGSVFTPSLNTTLNEKFSINMDDHTPLGRYPTCKYFVIGIGGKEVIDGVATYKYSTHQATDAALFEHIPFVLREESEDLDPKDRYNYRLRKRLELNGKVYYAYYAKVCNDLKYKNDILQINKSPYGDTLGYLDTKTDKYINPTPVNNTEIKGLPKDYDLTYVTHRFTMPFILNAFDMAELNNVYKVLGLSKDIKITELGVVHGYDVFYGNNYELCDAQITFHIEFGIGISVEFDRSKPFQRNIELGGAEPILVSKVMDV